MADQATVTEPVEVEAKPSDTNNPTATPSSESQLEMPPGPAEAEATAEIQTKQPAPGNLDKGLQRFQAKQAEFERTVEQVRADQVSTQQLMAQLSDQISQITTPAATNNVQTEMDDIMADMDDGDLVTAEQVKDAIGKMASLLKAHPQDDSATASALQQTLENMDRKIDDQAVESAVIRQAESDRRYWVDFHEKRKYDGKPLWLEATHAARDELGVEANNEETLKIVANSHFRRLVTAKTGEKPETNGTPNQGYPPSSPQGAQTVPAGASGGTPTGGKPETARDPSWLPDA